LKRDPSLLDAKNSLEAAWYDREAQDFVGQLDSGPGLMPMDRDFEELFGTFVDDPAESLPFDRDYVFFSSFPKASGLRILELGCGNGCLSRFFLRRGAEVVSLDLSRAYCRFLAKSDSGSLPLASSAEILPFKDETFDVVTAFVALHHFNLDMCLPEIRRVLKVNGKGIFLEPLGESRFFYKLRQLIPVADNESPGGGGLRSAELAQKLTQTGFDYTIRKFELFTRLERLPGVRRLQRPLRRLDHLMLGAFPWLGLFARSAVIEIKKAGR